MTVDTEQPIAQDGDEPVAEKVVAVEKPGAAIVAAREARDWSQQDLSSHTRLNINVIRALESDDFAGLGQPVYARGYYRKCANILALDEEALVRGYEQHTGTDSLVPRVSTVPPIAYRERVMLTPYILGAVLVILLGLMAWWWFSADPADIQSSPAPALDVETESVPPQAAAPAAAPTVAPAPEARPTVAPTAAPVATPAVEAASAAAAPVLKLELLGDSWVEVSDASGERLVRALLQGGVVREVQGEPPYQVILGDGRNVRVSLGDRKVDFSNQIESDRRARFRVDVPKP